VTETASPMLAQGRRELLRWLGWFTLANIVLAALIGLRYLFIYRFPADAAGITYALLAFVGQFAVLGFVAVFLPLVLLVVLWPRFTVVRIAAAGCGALLLALLVLDTGVFVEYRFHLSLLTAALFAWTTWLGFAVQLLIFALFQWLLAGRILGWVRAHPAGLRGGAVALLLVACWSGAQAMHIWGDAIGHTPVTQFSRYLPAYYPIHAKRRLARMGLVDPALAQERRLLRGAGSDGQLNYPLNPLDCQAEQAPNLLFILVDALRPDVLDPALLPRLSGAMQDSQVFGQHWSGGNSSRMGLFSMFYGLPAPYWQAFNVVQRPPVLLDELRRRDYALGLFSAVGFGSPTLLDRTVFAGVGELAPEKSASGINKNQAVTREWLEWLAGQSREQAFFGLLYYDPPMGEVPLAPGQIMPPHPGNPQGGRAAALWQDYLLALAMLDEEVGLVLDDLEERSLLDDTVIVFLSDHGYEFDDHGLGYFGHASAYTRAQLRATLYIRWPGRAPAEFAHRTSHHDLAPTLLSELFACQNDPADYSLGRSLFAGQDWEWIIAGSYSSWALIEPGRSTVSYPGGLVEVLGPEYTPEAGLRMDTGLVAEAMNALRRFYH